MKLTKMMKLTKPISSPGRTTSTNPSPLMKFLRNKSSSTRRRSSSSTRARSPMFFRKKHTQISHIQQEPSSPKVTCIGQIKHKHPNKKNQTPNRFCQCLRTLKPSFLCNVLTKWVSFFRCGYCENSHENNKQHTQSRQSEVSVPENNSSPKKAILNETGSFSKDPDSSNINEGVVIKSPPKNAFLLTRCRSAPYRSTSLASKLCETSVEEEVQNLEVKKDGYEGVISGDEELMVIKGIEGIKEREMPLFLTRCKSESGRKWDKFLV